MYVRISPLAVMAATYCAILIGAAASAMPATAQPVPPPPTVQGGQPGADASSPPPAPESRGANERLFDAINANNLDRAKQAVQAGADVNARNAFGTTAIDLAVDLGRYDIAFYLMSFRKTDPAQRPERRQADPARAEPEAAPGGFQPSFRLTPQPRLPVARDPIRQPEPAPPAVATPAAPPVPPGADPSGGKPVPSKGFLGFGPKGDESG